VSQLRFAFNLDTPDPSDFLTTIKKAGMTEVRIHISSDYSITELTDLCDLLKHEGMKAVFQPKYEIKTTGDSDATLKKIIEQPDEILARYTSVAAAIPTDICMGISLPIGMHLAVKSRYFSSVGLQRAQAVNYLNRVAAMIRGSNHAVVLPVILDDVKAENWKNVDCDVYDVEMMLSPSAAKLLTENAVQQSLQAANRRVWFGKAGSVGGHQMPSVALKTLKRLKKYTAKSNIEYAFLWSEKAVTNFAWSKDGVMVVDILNESFQHLNQ